MSVDLVTELRHRAPDSHPPTTHFRFNAPPAQAQGHIMRIISGFMRRHSCTLQSPANVCLRNTVRILQHIRSFQIKILCKP